MKWILLALLALAVILVQKHRCDRAEYYTLQAKTSCGLNGMRFKSVSVNLWGDLTAYECDEVPHL